MMFSGALLVATATIVAGGPTAAANDNRLAVASSSRSAIARTWSDKLRLSGTVAPSCSVTIRAAPIASSLDLSATSGFREASIGTVAEACEAPAGYDVWAASKSGGKLVGANPANRQLYHIRSDDGGWETLARAPTRIVETTTTTTTATRRLYLRYAIQKALPIDSYHDTITLVLTAN